MNSSDGRVILFLIIAVTVFVAGRRYQSLISSRQVWRDTMKAASARKLVASNAARSMLWVGVVTLFVFWLVANLNRIM
ncbi:hypothetical protein ACBI99_35545 [Nonomuraea sp. ATR24]|uniref:hypothetical protein n=1 Tax=Nonomuraea TaxID=83681 RepID=UPI001C5F3AA5|nr:hypothetical protein [Nonomuraea ceibae]